MRTLRHGNSRRRRQGWGSAHEHSRGAAAHTARPAPRPPGLRDTDPAQRGALPTRHVRGRRQRKPTPCDRACNATPHAFCATAACPSLRPRTPLAVARPTAPRVFHARRGPGARQNQHGRAWSRPHMPHRISHTRPPRSALACALPLARSHLLRLRVSRETRRARHERRNGGLWKVFFLFFRGNTPVRTNTCELSGFVERLGMPRIRARTLL